MTMSKGLVTLVGGAGFIGRYAARALVAKGWRVRVACRRVHTALDVRLAGPPNATIAALTVRIDLLDAQSRPLQQIWHVFDLTQIERGGPKDVIVRLPAGELAVEGIALDPVLGPTAEQERQIRELEL